MADDSYSKLFFGALAASNPDIPIPELPSLSEVKVEAERRSRQIFKNWHTLHRILLQHEAVLQKRWLKKTKDQRKKILLSAWPRMPLTHRPEFYAIQRESEEQRRTRSRFRDAYLFPYINQEDLLKAKNLLLLFHSRGHNKPDVFAFFDLKSQKIRRTSGVIVPSYLSGYTMLLTGKTTPETYGSIISWEEEPDAFALMMTEIGVQPGDGLVVLEIQDRLLQFLVHCAELVLHDLLQNVNVSPSRQVSVILPLQATAETEWPSIAVALAEVPYRVPIEFDMSRVQSLIRSKRLDAEDHIWSLREDPGYFLDFVTDWSEHRQEQLPSVNSKTHPVLGKPLFWERVLSNVVSDAYGNLLLWDLAQVQLAQLAAIRERHGHVTYDQPLPDDYAQALCHFSHLIDQTLKSPLINLTMGIVASPPLRPHFARKPQDPNSTIIQVVLKDPNRKDYLIWLIYNLLDEQQMFLCGLHNLLDEMDRVIRSNSESAGNAQNNRISPWISAVLSDIAVISEIQWRLSLHQPGYGATAPVSTEKLHAEFSKRTALVAQLHQALQQMRLADVGTPTFGRFDYPSEKRRTSFTTKKMREAEENLDLFWSTVDDHIIKKTGETLHDLLSSVISPRNVSRTSEWVEPIVSIPVVSEYGPSEKSSILQIEECMQRTIASDGRSQLRTKVKTRGPAAASVQEHVPSVSAESYLPPVIAVSKRAFKLFSILFHNPENEPPPGEILWSEFLHALSSTGFAVEKQYGSAWLFTPPNEGQRSIIFHEPHPSNKIPLHVARRHGRRLERAYGWTSATFVKIG
jgi:hypothetical protein